MGQPPTVESAVGAPQGERAQLLLDTPEGQWFDRKSARVEAKDLARTIVAFANADGGVMAIGLSGGRVEDVSRAVSRQNAWRQASVDFVEPPARTEATLLGVLDDNGNSAHLMLLWVESSERVHQTRSGDCYLRVGDETRKLAFRQRMELEFDKGQSQYDAMPLPDLTVDHDLDVASLERYHTDIGATGSVEHLLRARGFLTRRGDVTVGAFLMFGDHPQTVLPEAYVRVLRFAGVTRGTGADLALDDQGDLRIEGRIPDVVHRATAEISRRAPRRRALASSGRFEGRELIPRSAWLEGLVNAVVHRSYSLAGDHIRVEIYADRIEIESPGRFPGLARLDDPMKISRFARNPHIARACADLRLGQELGEGIRRIYQQMREHGLTDPRYTESAGSVRLVLEAAERLDPETAQGLPSGALDLLSGMRQIGEPVSTAEAQAWVGVSRPTVLRYLRALQRAGLVRWTGTTATDPQARWTLG